jgi:hypothetical protein
MLGADNQRPATSLLTHDRDGGPSDTIHADIALVQRTLPWDTGHHILIPRAARAPATVAARRWL